uniref:Cilia- and flagella-associated protein 52 n=1 Tax=Strigamia maritima TaxID=126957 RepID=T1J1U4_STRMM
MSTDENDVEHLEMSGFIGFNGRIMNGLLSHPNKSHVLYSAGNKVVIRNVNKRNLFCFLTGHCNAVSCLTVSPSGKFVAAGQLTHMVNKTELIVWDFEGKTKLAQHSYHKGKVQDVAFSCNELFIGSIGGLDDGNVVIVCLTKMEPIVVAPTTQGNPSLPVLIRFSNSRDATFVTAGKDTLRVWELDAEGKQLFPFNTQFGHVKRDICCALFDPSDKFVYCGTQTGDVVKIRVNASQSVVKPSRKECMPVLVSSVVRKMPKHTLTEASPDCLSSDGFYVQGVTALEILKNGDLVFGTGDGVVSHASEEFVSEKSKPLLGKPTTKENEFQTIFYFLIFNRSVAAWDDGKIRIFTPETGKLIYTIPNAHMRGATVVQVTSDCKHVVSGGAEGSVRIWELACKAFKMKATLQEHRSAITSLVVRKDDSECVSSSVDGYCIIWDIRRLVRLNVIFSNTMFTCVCYHPSECQILASGTNRKITYWETFDAQQVREVDGADSGTVTTVHVGDDGSCFVSGGTDKLIKLWKYDDGEVSHVSSIHTSDVNSAKISPAHKYILTGCEDGSLFVWKYPMGLQRHG